MGIKVNKVNIGAFLNSHGWLLCDLFHRYLLSEGISKTELERHNRTDGEVHYRYLNGSTKETFDFNGNYWSGKSFDMVLEFFNLKI